MIHGYYDFTKGYIIVDGTRDVPDGCCAVIRSSTAEDDMYLGTEWQCNHCLKPTSCTSCNPAYADAVIAQCPKHSGKTWHVDGKCLHCLYKE